jgi:outer membrane protein insertion porin family
MILKILNLLSYYLDDMKDKPYSSNSINNLLNEIDKLLLQNNMNLLMHHLDENITDENKINIEFIINESQKLYVDRINILGNDITNETVIRNLLIVDEGDPLMKF